MASINMPRMADAETDVPGDNSNHCSVLELVSCEGGEWKI